MVSQLRQCFNTYHHVLEVSKNGKCRGYEAAVMGMSAIPCLCISGLMTGLGVKVLLQPPRFVFLPQHNRHSLPGVVNPFQQKIDSCRDDGQGLFHRCRIRRKGHSISGHEPQEPSPQLACFDKAIAVSLSS